MVEKQTVVRSDAGLHNDQVTYFVQKANEFECGLWRESGNRKMNAKSLLGMMSLGVETGDVVTLYADGPDAEEALEALDALLQKDLF